MPLRYPMGHVLFVLGCPSFSSNRRGHISSWQAKNGSSSPFFRPFNRALTSEVLYQLSYVGACRCADGIAVCLRERVRTWPTISPANRETRIGTVGASYGHAQPGPSVAPRRPETVHPDGFDEP